MRTYIENEYLNVSLTEDAGLPNAPALVEGKVVKVDDNNVYVIIPGGVATIETLDLGNGILITQAVQIRTLDMHELDIVQWGVEVDAMLKSIAQNLKTHEYHQAAMAA